MTTTVRQIETVLIPAGAFTMGDDAGRPDERPAHRVTLSAFRMAVRPVTNEDYAAFLAATACEPPRFWDDPAFNHPRQPVVGISWYEATAYCDWASRSHGAPVRLPAEAEWERAARGGIDAAAYPWGDEWCSDWYDPGYYAVSPADDPPGPAAGERRASRGGAWRHAIKVSRCSARSSIPPDYRYNDYGFRVVTAA
jgi:sulfatase modifying factor 1